MLGRFFSFRRPSQGRLGRICICTHGSANAQIDNALKVSGLGAILWCTGIKSLLRKLVLQVIYDGQRFHEMTAIAKLKRRHSAEWIAGEVFRLLMSALQGIYDNLLNLHGDAEMLAFGNIEHNLGGVGG